MKNSSTITKGYRISAHFLKLTIWSFDKASGRFVSVLEIKPDKESLRDKRRTVIYSAMKENGFIPPQP